MTEQAAAVAAAVSELDDWLREIAVETRRQFIDRGVTRFDIILVTATDKGTGVSGSNPDRAQHVLLLRAALAAAESRSAQVVADRQVPRGGAS